MSVGRIERVDLDQILEWHLLEERIRLRTVSESEVIRVRGGARSDVQSIDRSGSCADVVRRTFSADGYADDKCEHGQCCQDSR